MKIKLTVPGEPFTGQVVTFTAPCDCAEVTDGLLINGKAYELYDLSGKSIVKHNVWCANAQVSVILDCEHKIAFVQSNGPAKVMLWKNANLNDTFGEQTLNLSLREYDGVEIIFYVDEITRIYGNSGFYPKDMRGYFSHVANADGRRMHRWFTAKDNGIEFSEGACTGSLDDNKVCIPYIIYGIKGVG